MSERIEAAVADLYAAVYEAGGEAAAEAAEKGVREILALESAEHVSDPEATVTGLQTALESIGTELAEIRAAVVKPRPAQPRRKGKVSAKARKAARKK